MTPRRLRYSAAMSLDGFIADEHGGYDWIPMNDEMDFAAFLAQIDAYVMGRHTYELVQSQPDTDFGWGDKARYVVSTTLDPAAMAPDFTLVSEGVEVGVIPVLLGAGIPLLPGLDGIAKLRLHSVEDISGIVLLKYDVSTDSAD